MKQIKLYNVIFPIWFLLFFPPVIFITLAGNFLIDSLVVLICFYAFKLASRQYNLKSFYWRNIFIVWLFGFLADFIGAGIIFAASILGDSWGLPYTWISAINFNPFREPAAILIIVIAMLVSAICIFILNYYVTFRKQIHEKRLRWQVALTIAILTIPWTFLLPTKWFYHGL